MNDCRRLESQWRSTAGGDSERMKELSEENRNAKEQVAIVQERIRTLQQESLAKEAQLAAARQEVQELRVHAVRTTVYRLDQSRLMTDTRSSNPSAVRGADGPRRFRSSLYPPPAAASPTPRSVRSCLRAASS